jgi:4-nitrophenyl phosphatase
LDRKITYQKLSHATLLIRSGVPFYGTNPDKTYPSPEGLTPGAGSILAAIQTATDVVPVIGGKPGRFMFDLALETLGTLPAETLSIGDRLDTDILGAQQAGCRTALVLSGITTSQEAAAWSPSPDIIVEDLSSLVNLLDPVSDRP